MGNGEFCDQAAVFLHRARRGKEFRVLMLLTAIFSGPSLFPPRLVVGNQLFCWGIVARGLAATAGDRVNSSVLIDCSLPCR